jgi:hypothetical protein
MMGRIEANNGRRENSPNNNKTIERGELENHNQSVRVNEQIRNTVTTDRLEKNHSGKDTTDFCRLVHRDKRFGRKCYLHVHSTVQIEATSSSKTSVPIYSYEATWRHTTQTIIFKAIAVRVSTYTCNIMCPVRIPKQITRYPGTYRNVPHSL